jgi:predicted transcriptional regulator
LEQINNSEKGNGRANITKKKYKKQIEWRQDMVRQLLLRGYSQSEITRQLHISQPTISRDIEYVRAHFSSDPKYYGNRIFTEYVNLSLATDEMLQNLWKLVDDSRISVKHRLKAMALMKEYLKFKSDLLVVDHVAIDLKEYGEKARSKEDELVERENKLRTYMIRHNLAEDFDSPVLAA